MRISIKDINIVDPNSPFNGKKAHVCIDHDKIVNINDHTPVEAETMIDGSGKLLSPGWIDGRVFTNDPGYEHKDDLQSISKAASFGGFTGVISMPDTLPVVQSKDMIHSVLSKSKELLIDVFPTAALTHDLKGKDLNELIDLHHAGAVAFTDGAHSIAHSGVLFKSLQYVQQFEGMLINKPYDPYFVKHGQVHEGIPAMQVGLKGIPYLAETLMLKRDLDILRYTGGKLHVSTISCADSIQLIREAKKEGLHVTCDVAVHQLVFTDETALMLDTNYKVLPPYRTEIDRLALVDALLDGTIDIVVSDHTSQDVESKQLEFDMADFGILGLESLFGILNNKLSKATNEQLVQILAIQPRRVFGLETSVINVGEKANLTLFDRTTPWKFDVSSIKSKGMNTPFLEESFTGKALAVFNKGRMHSSI